MANVDDMDNLDRRQELINNHENMNGGNMQAKNGYYHQNGRRNQYSGQSNENQFTYNNKNSIVQMKGDKSDED